jgi:pyridoxine 5'-phosphate synthase PdxJ
VTAAFSRELVRARARVCAFKKTALVTELRNIKVPSIIEIAKKAKIPRTTLPALRRERRHVHVLVVQQLKQRRRTLVVNLVAASSVSVTSLGSGGADAGKPRV